MNNSLNFHNSEMIQPSLIPNEPSKNNKVKIIYIVFLFMIVIIVGISITVLLVDKEKNKNTDKVTTTTNKILNEQNEVEYVKSNVVSVKTQMGEKEITFKYYTRKKYYEEVECEAGVVYADVFMDDNKIYTGISTLAMPEENGNPENIFLFNYQLTNDNINIIESSGKEYIILYDPDWSYIGIEELYVVPLVFSTDGKYIGKIKIDTLHYKLTDTINDTKYNLSNFYFENNNCYVINMIQDEKKHVQEYVVNVKDDEVLLEKTTNIYEVSDAVEFVIRTSTK